jgi:hypothetical protein
MTTSMFAHITKFTGTAKNIFSDSTYLLVKRQLYLNGKYKIFTSIIYNLSISF